MASRDGTWRRVIDQLADTKRIDRDMWSDGKICEAIRQASIFSIVADETTDNSTKQQLAICVRYVDETALPKCVREDFVGIVSPEETTGVYLAAVILDKLRVLGLDVAQLRGQGYDGGSNMSGRISGVQVEIGVL